MAPASVVYSVDASLIVVGQEILDGFTLDTNSQYLLDRLRERGIRTVRVTTVADDRRAIGDALRYDLKNGVGYVFVGGGLGPTPDDLTVQAVAKILRLPLKRHPAVWNAFQKRMRERYTDGRLTAAVRRGYEKMALMPRGAVPFRNRAGAAPGIHITVDRRNRKSVSIFLLPGVPKEFRTIVKEEIEPNLGRGGSPLAVVEIHTSRREAEMTDMLEEVTRQNPEVTIGSYPQAADLVILRFKGPKHAVDRAVERAESALDRIDEERENGDHGGRGSRRRGRSGAAPQRRRGRGRSGTRTPRRP